MSKGPVILTYNDTGKYIDNDVIQRFSPNGGEYVLDSFENTTNGIDNEYELFFGSRDVAGIISIGNAHCRIGGVQTTRILGLLEKDECFIATATFKNRETWPVRVLRKFRDKILFKFEFGKKLVSWYYSWSPEKAVWLRTNPLYRWPVMVGLAPIIAIAFLVLNPILSGVMLLLFFGVFIPNRTKWSFR